MITVISSNRGPEVLATNGKLTAATLHEVAEAFVKDGRPSDIRDSVRKVFGKWGLRSYCLDLTGPHRCRITFSTRSEPDLVFYRGGPCSIAPNHAVKLEIYVDEVEPVALIPLGDSARPFDAGQP